MKSVILSLLVLCTTALFAQNLVPNPSFEVYSGCPAGSWVNQTSWFLVPSHTGSPDCFNTCGNSTWGVPTNVFGSQNARTGLTYVGFVTNFGTGSTFREYLEVQLPTPMVSGTSYDVSAWLTLSDGSGWATDGFGMYFSTSLVSGSGTNAALPYTPQVDNPLGYYFNDKVNWMPFTGTFTATANYNYLVFGNFRTNANTGVQVQASGWSWNYTYLDDVSVVPSVVFSADLLDFTGELQDQGVQLDWQTASENGTQAFELQRSVGDAAHFETIATLPAAGGPTQAANYNYFDADYSRTSENWYRVREVDGNGGGGYSQAIEIMTEAAKAKLELKVFPSPATKGENIRIYADAGLDQELQYQIVDVQGRLLQRGDLNLAAGLSETELDIRDFATGTYFIALTGNGINRHLSFMVK